ncbi:hypothetical protein ES288_A09G141100v1 [Gossypium darwinii]|uniref:Uncharacterized protein n=1 Tax=Gossypium darwinii TaxID=34276 RepID=A0A5D2F8R1_GOSDA|nr:hypothetical protein ES288_A09G141100v1 [Gossypium darwinii]
MQIKEAICPKVRSKASKSPLQNSDCDEVSEDSREPKTEVWGVRWRVRELVRRTVRGGGCWRVRRLGLLSGCGATAARARVCQNLV